MTSIIHKGTPSAGSELSALLVAVACVAVIPMASRAATWNQTAAGTYDWTDTANWTSGTLPTSTTDALLNSSSYRPAGDQTITGDGSARSLDLHNNTPGRTRTFTGDITASNLVLRVGTVNVEGTLTLTGTDQTCSILGAAYTDSKYGATLDIKSGGTVRADSIHGIYVGRRASTDNNNAAGRIFLRDGGCLILNPSDSTAGGGGLLLGRLDGSRTGIYGASYVQFGGEAVLGRFLTGYEKNTFASLSILGGTLDLPYISTETRFRIGHRGYGVFQLLGGDVTVGTNRAGNLAYDYTTRPWAFEVGSGNTTANGLNGAHFYAGAGSMSSKLDIAIQGPTWNYTGVAPAYATIDGTACITSRTVRVGESLNDGLAVLNLNGGVLVTDALYAQMNRAGRSIVNANGGKLVFPSSASATQGLNIDAINIYEGGLGIECAAKAISLGNAATNVLLRTPGGYGIDMASFSSIADSFTVPWIEISGGSGSNACAVALVDYDTSTTTNAAVACRGEGFAADDAPTATICRPYKGDTTIALSVSENKPGALVKTGAYNLNLFAQPEFAGTYEVRQGLLNQTTTAGVAAPRVTAVVVGGTDGTDGSGNPKPARFQAGSGNATAVEANWNPVNPSATLTLGTPYGAGRLEVPAASVSAGETQPFTQTFASLSVSGTGNEIGWASGNSDHSAGAKVVFGTISCADGSQLTIPNPRTDPTFKVYVTGMSAGTQLKNVFLDGTGRSVVVGDDGQLVKMPVGFSLVVK